MKKILNKKTLDKLILIGFNWFIFSMLVGAYVLWVQNKTLRVQEAEIKKCQEFNALVNEQLDSGRIILNLKKEEK